MVSEHCPHCQVTRNMRLTISRREETALDGHTKKIETRSFHCEMCNTFVRSEDTDLNEAMSVRLTQSTDNDIP